MIKRVITGACFALLVLVGILLQGLPMLALLSFAMIVSTREMYKALHAAGVQPICWVGYLFCALIIAAKALNMYVPNSIDFSMIALLASVMLAMAQLVLEGKIALERMAATLLPMLYPGIFYIALLNLLLLNDRASTTTALVLAFFAASVNDVFALFTGMLLGRHKLSPELSPKKTIEGSIGGLVASTLFAAAVPALLRLIFHSDAAFIAEMALLPPTWAFALLGLFTGALSQIGDLTASMVKRRCGVKDFGKLLPGHGGVMDRMDGVLFCGAICYIFFKLFNLG